MPTRSGRHGQGFAAREHAMNSPPLANASPKSSPFALDSSAIAIGIAVGCLALLILGILCLRRERLRHRTRSPDGRRIHMKQISAFRNACPPVACPARRHPLRRLAGKLPWPPRKRQPTSDLPDVSDEEEPIMKSQPDDEEAGTRPASGGGADEEGVEMRAPSSDGPQPLPAPSVLDAHQPPPPRPHYSHLELRLLEGDNDTAHCWASLPSRHVSVRSASYLRDGKKAASEPASLCLAVELFRSSQPVHDVAGRADSPAHTLRARPALDRTRARLGVRHACDSADQSCRIMFVCSRSLSNGRPAHRGAACLRARGQPDHPGD